MLARENLGDNLTLREYLKCHKTDARLQCLELGLFKIEPDEGVQHQVFVKNFGLSERLFTARKVAIQSSFTCLASLREGRAPAYIDLAVWLAMYEKFRVREAGQLLPQDEIDVIHRWCSTSLCSTHSIQQTHQQLPHGVKLWDLNVAEHGSDVVEWATELIGLNMCRMDQAARKMWNP